jgi:hypothetical protein
MEATAQDDQIQGLPPGAIAEPIGQPAIKGLPPGAQLEAIPDNTAPRDGQGRPQVMMTKPDGTLGYASYGADVGQKKNQGWKVGPPSQQPLTVPQQLFKAGVIDPIQSAVEMGGAAKSYIKSQMDAEQRKTPMDRVKELPSQLGTALFPPAPIIASMARNAGTASVQLKNPETRAIGTVSALSAVNPFSAPVTDEMQQLRDAGRDKEADFVGLMGATGLAAGPIAGELVDAGAGAAKNLVNSVRPKPPLARALPGISREAAIDAHPQIQVALQERGVTPAQATAQDVIEATDHAKGNVLRQAQEQAGEGQTIFDLSPEDQTAVKQKIANLDEVKKGVIDAQKQVANAKPNAPATRTAATGLAAKGMGKVVLGDIAGRFIPGGRLLGDIFGITKGVPDLTQGVKGMIRPQLTPELLDTRLQNALSVPQETAGLGLSATAGEAKPPYVPPSGDMSVQPESAAGGEDAMEEARRGAPNMGMPKPQPTPAETPQPAKVPQFGHDEEGNLLPKEEMPDYRARAIPPTDEEINSKLQQSLPQSKQTVGTAEGAKADTNFFMLAKQKLGSKATISEIAREAQRLKLESAQTSPEELLLRESLVPHGFRYNPATNRMERIQ